MTLKPNLRQFYIPEEQSIYLLSHQDAQKLRDWIQLCQSELVRAGYREVELIGSGAYGFVFGGITHSNEQRVFKFARITLPPHIQNRLEEEAFMLQQIVHPLVPKFIRYVRTGNQSILAMERAPGMTLEELSLEYGPLPPPLTLKIAFQLSEILLYLRNREEGGIAHPIVHGDIKPSNIVMDPNTEEIRLIDWGSSVYAQIDAQGQPICRNLLDLMTGDFENSHAKLGDIYFIGEEQMSGGLASPRFDEQGVAGTLYALASGQAARFGHAAIPSSALHLPQEFARTLDAMMSTDPDTRHKGGDYFLRNMRFMKNIVLRKNRSKPPSPSPIPYHLQKHPGKMDTVVYTSRRSFLREGNLAPGISQVKNPELDRYYKNFLQGMGEKEKAFLASVSRLGKYAVVGGLAVRWTQEELFIDSHINLYEPSKQIAFNAALNNLVTLARSIRRVGVFKSCLFKARDTLHIERNSPDLPFIPSTNHRLKYSIQAQRRPDEGRQHSYFEDGEDPDEFLELPGSIRDLIAQLNSIHHTGCIIFESLPYHLKIHNYYVLLNPQRKQEFEFCLREIIRHVPEIRGLGISGFMKFPYKDTRVFPLIDSVSPQFYPKC